MAALLPLLAERVSAMVGLVLPELAAEIALALLRAVLAALEHCTCNAHAMHMHCLAHAPHMHCTSTNKHTAYAGPRRLRARAARRRRAYFCVARRANA